MRGVGGRRHLIKLGRVDRARVCLVFDAVRLEPLPHALPRRLPDLEDLSHLCWKIADERACRGACVGWVRHTSAVDHWSGTRSSASCFSSIISMYSQLSKRTRYSYSHRTSSAARFDGNSLRSMQQTPTRGLVCRRLVTPPFVFLTFIVIAIFW